MGRMDDIKHAVTQLSPEEMNAFREWFEELQANLWDEKIERDIAVGKLDKLAEKALADYRAGRTDEL